MLTSTYNPGFLPPDGTLHTDATQRQIAAGTITLNGKLENSQITDDTIDTAKIAPTARRFLNLGWHNIMDPAHGGAGDGSTDDRAALESVIAAAVADATASVSRSAVVYLPPGHYVLSTFSSGSLSAGGYCAQAGNQTGDPISLIFYGPGAILDNQMWQASGTNGRLYVTLRLQANLRDVLVDGIIFQHTGITASTASQIGTPVSLDFASSTAIPSAVFNGVIVQNCRFTNGQVRLDQSSGTVNRTRKALFSGCRWSSDRGADTLGGETTFGGGQFLRVHGVEDITVSDCDFDCCTADDITLNSAAFPVDGGPYLAAVRRANVCSCRVYRPGVEGIYLVGSSIASDARGGKVVDCHVDCEQPVSSSRTTLAAIVVDQPETLVANNTVDNARRGIRVGETPGALDTGRYSIITGNMVRLADDNVADNYGIYLLAADSVAENNHVVFGTYAAGSSGQIVSGITMQGARTLARNNRVIGTVKNALGGLMTVGVTIVNDGSTYAAGARIEGNRFYNINQGIHVAPYTDTLSRYAADNTFDSCDASAGGPANTSPSHLHLHVVGLLHARQTIRWTPAASATTGWYIIATASQAAIGGRLVIQANRSYNGLADGTMEPTYAVLELEQIANASSVIQTSTIRQISAHNINGGAITGVRLTVDATYGDRAYIEVNLATTTAPTEIILTWETPCRGCGLVSVPFLNTASIGSGSTAQSTLTLNSAALTVVANTLGSSSEFIGNGTPEAAVTAPVGSIYRRLNGGADSTFYVKESGTGNTGWVAPSSVA